MQPHILTLMCQELESSIDLQSLSFRKNIMPKSGKIGEFTAALSHLIA